MAEPYPAAGEACYLCGYVGGGPPREDVIFCSEGSHHAPPPRPLTWAQAECLNDHISQIMDDEIFRVLLSESERPPDGDAAPPG